MTKDTINKISAEKMKQLKELQEEREFLLKRSKAGEIAYLDWAEQDADLLCKISEVVGLGKISLR